MEWVTGERDFNCSFCFLRNKLKIANSLKSTKKTMERETAQVLTSEQIKKWDQIKEAAKESN